MVSGSSDGSIKLWDLDFDLELKVLRGHHGKIWSVKFSPDGKYVLSGSSDQNSKMWEATTGSVCKMFRH